MDSEFESRNRKAKVRKQIKEVADVYGVDTDAVWVVYGTCQNFDVRDSVLAADAAEPPPEWAELAKTAGMLHEPVELTHDEFLEKLVAARKHIDQRALADAFIVGLQLETYVLTTQLASYIEYRFLEPHEYEDWIWLQTKRATHRCCKLCGIEETQRFDHSRTNIKRLRLEISGGLPTRHDALVDFTDFPRLPLKEPNAEQRDNFHQLLENIRSLPDKSRTGDLAKACQGLVKGNKYRKLKMMEILGWCGILKPEPVPWSPDEPIEHIDLSELGIRTNREMQYPVCGWCGADGVNEEAVAYWFPGFEKT